MHISPVSELGNLLLDDGSFDQVVLAPVAITGSEVCRWAPGGDLNGTMIDAASQLQRLGYRVTHVLWVQGEIEYVKGTNEKDYRDRFLSLASSVRSHAVGAPVSVHPTVTLIVPVNLLLTANHQHHLQ